MIQTLFTVYDTKTESNCNPITFPSTAACIRALSDLMAEGTHEWAKHPSDYELYKIGTFDTQAGFIEAQGKSKMCICSLNELLEA